MAVLTKFCFCCGLRAGCMFVATYSLLSSAFFIALLLIRNIGYQIVESSIIHAVVTYGSFVLFGLLMLVSVGLIIGVHRESRWMFIPWLVQTLVALLFATGTIVWLIVTIIRSDQGLESWETALVTFHSINLICSSYCILCVISLFQDLSKREPSTRPNRRERRVNRSTAENGAVTQGATASNGVPRPPALSVVMPPPYADKPPPYTTFPRGAPQLTLAPGQQPPATATAAGTAAPPAAEAVPGEDDLPPYSTFPRGVPDQLVAATSGTRANIRQPEPGHEDLGDAPPYSTFPRGVPPELLAHAMESRPRSIHPPPIIEEDEEEGEEEGEGELREQGMEEADEGGEEVQVGEEEDVLEPQQVEEEEGEVSEREVGEEEEEEREASGQEEEEEHQEEELEDIQQQQQQQQQQQDVPQTVRLTMPDEAEDSPVSDSCGQDVLLVPELGTASYSGRSSGSSVSAIQIPTDNSYGGPLENNLQPLLPSSSDGDTDTDIGTLCDEDAVTAIYATPIKKPSTISTEDTLSRPDISMAQESVMPPESPSIEPPPVPQKLFAEAESVAAPNPVSQNREPPVSSSDHVKALKQRQEEVPTGHMMSPPPTLGPASSRREAEIREIKQRLRRVGALPREPQDSPAHQEKVPGPLPAEIMQQMGPRSSSDTKKVTARMEVAAVDINHERSSPAGASSSHMPQQHSPHVQHMDISIPSLSKVDKHDRPITSSRADPTSTSAPALSPAIRAQLEVVLDRGRRLKDLTMREKGAPTETRSGPLSSTSNVNWEKYNTELKNRAQKQLSAVSRAGWSPGHPHDKQERARTTENQHLMTDSNESGDSGRTPQQQERRQRGLPRAQLEGLDNPQYNTDPLTYEQEPSPETWRRQDDTRDERIREGWYLKPLGKSRDRPRSDDRDRHRPDERDRIRFDERDRIRPDERDRVRTDEKDRIMPDEKDRPRPDERDRLRPDERGRPRSDERDRGRPEERDILRQDERDMLRPDERDRIRSDERDKLRKNDRERQKLDDKDRMWLEDRDKGWPEDREFIHPNGTAYNMHRQLQPEYIPHAKRLSRENNDPYWENWKYAGNRGVGGSPRLDMNSRHRGKQRVYSERQEGDSKYHMQNLHDHYK